MICCWITAPKTGSAIRLKDEATSQTLDLGGMVAEQQHGRMSAPTCHQCGVLLNQLGSLAAERKPPTTNNPTTPADLSRGPILVDEIHFVFFQDLKNK